MRSAAILLIVAVAVTAEAPYNLPRPAPHAPPFGYPSGPSPPSLPPAPFPQLPQPRPAPQPFAPFPNFVSAPHPSHTLSQGYNYQQPSIGPAFVQPIPQPAPRPIPVYRPPPPVHLPTPLPQPLPIAYPQPIPITYPQPQPLPISYPRPQPIPIPQPNYGLPQPQPQPQPQPRPQPLPNYYYNVAQTLPAPIAPLPAYQQPISHPQYAAPLPLHSQPLTSNAVSSYQADSTQYATAQAQTHGEALDQTVVNQVQNIIRDSEHSSAKNAGYLSLVSGVTLESAKPSVEISSFVHNSPQSDAGLIDIRSVSSSGGQSLTGGGVSVSSSYDAPSIAAGSIQSSDSSANVGFLPNNKPGTSYGVPN